MTGRVLECQWSRVNGWGSRSSGGRQRVRVEAFGLMMRVEREGSERQQCLPGTAQIAE